MSDFKAKSAQNSISAWASPQTPLGSLKRSPDLLAVFMGPTSKGWKNEGGERGEGKGEGKGREEDGEGRGGKRGKGGEHGSQILWPRTTPKLLLHAKF